jgi:hypothetical protein
MAATETRLDITVPNREDSQWGVALTDHYSCKTVVEFDVRVEPGALDYYGFAVVPRGSVVDDQASGDEIQFFMDSDGTFIAQLSGLPTPFLGAKGSGAYPVADLRQTRHVVVAADGGVYTAEVDGTPAGEYAELTGSCGQPLIVAWGGTTVHIDHVQVR